MLEDMKCDNDLEAEAMVHGIYARSIRQGSDDVTMMPSIIH